MRVVFGLLIALSAAFQTPAGDADEILAQLSKIHLDKKQIYNVRDITIRRDVLTISLNRGLIAFLEPVQGKVTGAVFIGSGEIVALPPDTIEKQQIYKFTGTPVLNEAFDSGIFRFSDGTYAEVQKEISQHAVEEVSAEDVAQFDPWEMSLAASVGASGLNLRLLPDFLETASKPYFIGELKGEKTGWFSVVFDMRATEEVSVFQVREIGAASVANIWASFNQRSEARNPELIAKENKSPIDILTYDIDGAAGQGSNVDLKVVMRAKARTDDVRVLDFDLSPGLRLTSLSTEMDERVPYYQTPGAGHLTAVLQRPLKANQDLTLRFAYTGEITGLGPWYPSQHQQTIPAIKSNVTLPEDGYMPLFEHSGHKVIAASYHDRWLVEGLTRYFAVMSADAGDPAEKQLHKLLGDTREELKTVESAGPISIGQRVISLNTPNGYRAVSGKGLWVVHMLRMMLRQGGSNPDEKFLAMIKEFSETFDGKSASTWDFKHLAEKYTVNKLDSFFDQWVFATGMPSYSVDYKIETAGNEFTIEGKITQMGVPEGFVMSVPVYADSDFLGKVQVGESDGQFRYRVSKKPEKLVIDPEMTILTSTSQ
jgi:hypothetical protein